MWAGREDLRRAYPGVEEGDVDGFLGWCCVYGREQIEIPDVLLPQPAPDPSPGAPAAAPPAARESPPVERPFGVNVAGYLRSELGIGEVARQLVAGLDAAGVPVLPVGLHAPDSRQGHAYLAGGHEHNPFPINIVCVNADGLPHFARDAGERFFEGRYTIGVWWWETGDFPPRYMDAFEHVDEVWVGSSFVAQALIEAPSPVPVVTVPIPLRFAEPPPLRPGEYGWPDAFTYLFSWDYCSVFARKNPLAAIEAYTAAFGDRDGTALVLKCINTGFDPVGHRTVKEAIAGRDDIVLIDEYLDPGDKDRLMGSCDCYVSLHRSEGLGLTIAEAMYHRKPVIATGYSGNADFMTADNSYPVGHRVVPIGPGAEPYPADGTWAEPDVAEAARLMRRVREQPEEAAARAARAGRDIRTRYSAATAGAVMRTRLERVVARAGTVPTEDLPEPPELEHARRLVRRRGAPDRPSRFGKPGGAVRRLALRAMRPYTAYQHDVNVAVEQSLDALVDAQRHDTRLERLEVRAAEAQASVLAQLRMQRTQIEDLTAALSAEHLARAQGDEAPARLVAETRALPYMSSDAFRVFEAGPVRLRLRLRRATEGRAGRRLPPVRGAVPRRRGVHRRSAAALRGRHRRLRAGGGRRLRSRRVPRRARRGGHRGDGGRLRRRHGRPLPCEGPRRHGARRRRRIPRGARGREPRARLLRDR